MNRGYQKSIIEMELEEQRRDKGMLWQQTKESILEARGIISSTNSIACDVTRIRNQVGLTSSAGKVVNGGDYQKIPLLVENDNEKL